MTDNAGLRASATALVTITGPTESPFGFQESNRRRRRESPVPEFQLETAAGESAGPRRNESWLDAFVQLARLDQEQRR